MKLEFSAGGIVYKKENGKILILVAQHSQHHGWVFPKGLIENQGKRDKKSATRDFGPLCQSVSEASETKEEAALREVREETGVYGKIIKSLKPVSYWYKFKENKIKKTVYYFLMEYLSGDITDHDFEMENVEWLPIDDVKNRLTYKSDRKAWEEAEKIVLK